MTDTICGYVTDEEGMSIAGATVELWANWPYGSPVATTTTNENGAFFFGGEHPTPYDLYAYASGYYPNWKLENYGTQCGTIELRQLQELIPVDRWVDYYCGFATLDDSIALPIGTVVEVKDADGTLAGRQIVTEPGVIRFMPVYRDSAGSDIDEGAETGDMLWFYVNGMIAETSPSEVIYPADYAQVEVCVNGSLRGGKVCQLMEGWNLVSWNVDTPTDSIEAVLGEIMECVEVVLGFEGGGLTYDPELEQFSTLWQTDHMSGYWIKVKTGCSPELRLAGSVVPANTPIPVYRGWNLVSYLPEMTMIPEDALVSVNDHLLIAYGYDNGIQVHQPGMGDFNTLEEMMTCHGYWMKLSTDDVLIYPGGETPVLTTAIESPYAAAARVSAATDVNTTIAWVNLYSRDLTVDGRTVKAGSSIEAYSLSGTKIGSFRMQRDGQFGFMPVYSDAGLNENITGLKPGEKFTLRVNGEDVNETIVWTTTGDRIELGRLTTATGGTLPGSFSLAQNYPNPFNPTTTISFSLPSKGTAKIEIYNVLGKLVAVPFNGSVEAGEHQVVWNGKNETGEAVASGVYFYRLTADNYTDTKKMMLLK
ncbi:MAG: T9SS type A sorting domain-containing protein [bacterium]|nr:T9SS type A sorting domain-containing protein [bacterium]